PNSLHPSLARRAVGRPRPDAHVGELADWRRLEEEPEQVPAAVDQRAVAGQRLRRQAIHDFPEPRLLARLEAVAPVLEPMQQDAGEHQLEAALGHRQETEVLGDDLTLLGDLDPPAHRPRWKRGERPRYRRASPTSHGAAAAVKQSPRGPGVG